MRLAKGNERRPDDWLFPDETLAQGGGDCEDLAFVLAAILTASGVSSYCVRVALGSLNISRPRGEPQRHDHCWVMYQNESGAWEILEPMAAVRSKSAKSKAPALPRTEGITEYVPHYVFNSNHLWLIHSRDSDSRQPFNRYCRDREFWSKFDPSFAAGVHSTIFDAALKGLVPDSALSTMRRKSLSLDVNIAGYDPRDHFDNGYIDEGWARVNDHLTRFREDNSDWESLGAAGHTIADFYAHSSYVHFAQLQNPVDQNGQAALYDPGVTLVVEPSYTATPSDPSPPPFDLTSGHFTVNDDCWHGTPQQTAAQWQGKLISGRNAQLHDRWATFWEGFTSIPRELTEASDFAVRGSLPHHDEMAVDDAAMGRRHRLYSKTGSGPDDRQSYPNQFRWRVNTAVQHIKKAFEDNWDS
jgi:hypothetical protein